MKGSTMAAGLPGLTRVDHIGVTVPDIEQARRFFVDTLGGEFLFSLAKKADPVSSWMTDTLNVHPRAVIEEIHFFRAAGSVFEVFEYSAPDQRSEVPRNSDIGGHHVALYVEDLDLAVAYLRDQPGITVLGGPVTSAGANEGQRWIYFLSPWGMQFELVSYPGGKAFDRRPLSTPAAASAE